MYYSECLYTHTNYRYIIYFQDRILQALKVANCIKYKFLHLTFKFFYNINFYGFALCPLMLIRNMSKIFGSFRLTGATRNTLWTV